MAGKDFGCFGKDPEGYMGKDSVLACEKANLPLSRMLQILPRNPRPGGTFRAAMRKRPEIRGESALLYGAFCF